jgi:ferredoxin-NADP reductase
MFVAGGIGITPFRSILVEAAHQGQKLKVDLLYANRTTEIPFADELNEIAADNPDLKISYIVQPDRLDAQTIAQHYQSSDNPLVYISGPEPMVESLTDELKGLGIPEDSIKGDYFPGYKAE